MKNLQYAFRLLLLITAIIGLSGVNNINAQETVDSTGFWEVVTADGNKYYGELILRNSEKVIIDTEILGELTIDMKNVVSIEEVESNRMIEGQYWSRNLLSRRYFFVPNAFSLKQGEGYYQNSLVFFNQVSVGLTDNFTLGAGMIPLFLIAGTSTPVWITPKISIPFSEDKFSLGIGALAGTVLGESNSGFGIAYGVGTIGNADANLSLNVGYGNAGGDWANKPTISFSGMIRLNKRTYLMSENYVLDFGDEKGFLSFIGGRTVWDSISLDYALILPLGGIFGGEVVALPWLSLVIPFGKN